VKYISANALKVGDYVVNIGTVEKIEVWPEAKKVSFTVSEALIISARFFWFEDTQMIAVKS
jgi:hypothetical protein